MLGGVYRPLNYDEQFHGKVSVRTALASSMNVPAVLTLKLMGSEALLEKLNSLGFENLSSAEDYGMSLALGTADVTLMSLTNAYRSLANRGVFSLYHFQKTSLGTDDKTTRMFSEGASFIVADILSDPDARRIVFGPSNMLNMARWAAVKTGTSKDMRDNWCIGFTHKVTVGVWVGNFGGEPMWNVSGVSGAAPGRDRFLAPAAQPSEGTEATQGLVQKPVLEFPLQLTKRNGFSREPNRQSFLLMIEASCCVPLKLPILPITLSLGGTLIFHPIRR